MHAPVVFLFLGGAVEGARRAWFFHQERPCYLLPCLIKVTPERNSPNFQTEANALDKCAQPPLMLFPVPLVAEQANKEEHMRRARRDDRLPKVIINEKRQKRSSK